MTFTRYRIHTGRGVIVTDDERRAATESKHGATVTAEVVFNE